LNLAIHLLYSGCLLPGDRASCRGFQIIVIITNNEGPNSFTCSESLGSEGPDGSLDTTQNDKRHLPRQERNTLPASSFFFWFRMITESTYTGRTVLIFDLPRKVVNTGSHYMPSRSRSPLSGFIGAFCECSLGRIMRRICWVGTRMRPKSRNQASIGLPPKYSQAFQLSIIYLTFRSSILRSCTCVINQ
jgi:hypothetical protein